MEAHDLYEKGETDSALMVYAMLAEMGYDAFAVDLYGKGNRPVETGAKKAETGKLYQNRERMRSLILGGLEVAREAAPGEVVVMGYCFGGAVVLNMARMGLDLDGVVDGWETDPNDASDDVVSKIKKLKELLDEGILTEEEYQKKKDELVSQI